MKKMSDTTVKKQQQAMKDRKKDYNKMSNNAKTNLLVEELDSLKESIDSLEFHVGELFNSLIIGNIIEHCEFAGQFIPVPLRKRIVLAIIRKKNILMDRLRILNTYK